MLALTLRFMGKGQLLIGKNCSEVMCSAPDCQCIDHTNQLAHGKQGHIPVQNVVVEGEKPDNKDDETDRKRVRHAAVIAVSGDKRESEVATSVGLWPQCKRGRIRSCPFWE